MPKKAPKQSQYYRRIHDELKEVRKNILGENLEDIWKQSDEDYLPHRLGKKGKKILVQDETLGWASRYVELGKDDWQSDAATLNPLIKIQTALSILIGKNPGVDLTPSNSKYENATKIQKQLYQKSWELGRSLQQLKLFVFNLAKYGWAVARSYPLKLQSGDSVEFNGIFRENLNPWMTWIDDTAKPNNPLTIRDWAFAKWYPWKALEKEFKDSKNWKFIQKGKSGDLALPDKSQPTYVSKDLKLVYFYENIDDDISTVLCDGIPLIEEKLPLADSAGNKKLSLWQTHWMLRHAEIPYGIGLAEVIHNDKVLYDKVRNMTIDQIILSIYKMFFYEGTDQIDSDGNIKIRPGIGRQVTNAKNIKWLEVPGAGKEAKEAIEMMQNALDEGSGITKPLTGQEIGKTAYESAQAAEFSLKRLSTPLGNITDALEQEAQLTMILNEMIYSTPEIIKIVSPNVIKDYYQEIGGDPQLYQRDEAGNFYAKLYPEVQMNLEADDQGQLVESEKARFFRAKPKSLKWEGIVNVKGQSILAETKVLAKQMTMELFNIITPMFQWPKELALKAIKQLCKKYEVDWQDWVPDIWIEEQPQAPQGLFVPQGQQQGMEQTLANQTVLPKNEIAPAKASLTNKAASIFGKPASIMGR